MQSKFSPKQKKLNRGKKSSEIFPSMFVNFQISQNLIILNT